MNVKAIEGRIESAVAPVVSDLRYALVDTALRREEGRWVLRLRIDHAAPREDERRDQSTVTIAECAKVSRAIQGVLDVDADIPMDYILEVSSPGVDRPLRTAGDFARFPGREVDLTTRAAIANRRHFVGLLEGIQDAVVSVVVDGVTYAVPLASIEKAKLTGRDILQKKPKPSAVH